MKAIAKTALIAIVAIAVVNHAGKAFPALNGIMGK
jgi:hypothetical protein